MKTQINFKYQEWESLSKFIGLAERDHHTPLNSQAYLCSLPSRTRLQINPPIVPEAADSPPEKSSINTIPIWKAGVAKHMDTHQEECMETIHLPQIHAQHTQTWEKGH